MDGVPFTKEFVDRSEEIETLQTHLLPTRHLQPKRRSVVVVNGLGGIGKTQLAVEFARRNSKMFSAIFWLDARNEDSVRRSFAAIAGRLPEGQGTEPCRAHMLENMDDLNAPVKKAREWLSIPDNTSWLLIFDNVDHDFTNAQAAPQAYDIRRFFPTADHGSIIITTRLSSLGQLGVSLRVGRVDKEQAVAIFRKGYGRDFQGEQN